MPLSARSAALPSAPEAVWSRGLLLGALGASGGTAIYMSLPAAPQIAASLGVTVEASQSALVAFFCGSVLGQAVFGPLSDVVGRRPPLVAGFAVFALASLGCAEAGSLDALIAARFLQGLGASAGGVTRAIVRDWHSGADAARLQSAIAAVSSISPMVAPLLGSAVLAAGTWRGPFLVNAVWASACLALVWFVLRETLPASRRGAGGAARLIDGYRRLLSDRSFFALIAASGLMVGVQFAYLAGAPLLFMTHQGLAGWRFSLICLALAIIQIAAVRATPRMLERLGGAATVRAAGPLALLGCAAFCAAILAAPGSTVLSVAALTAMQVGVGLKLIPISVLTQDRHHAVPGAATSLLALAQTCLGAGAAGLVSLLADGTDRPAAFVMLGCAALGTLCARVGLRRWDAPRQSSRA